MMHEPLTEQEKQEQSQETFQVPVPEGKRTALLRYLIIMFAVAFVLVLMSMVLQVRSSNATVSQLHQSSTSALTRAQKLQDDNRALSVRVAVLEQELTATAAAASWSPFPKRATTPSPSTVSIRSRPPTAAGCWAPTTPSAPRSLPPI